MEIVSYLAAFTGAMFEGEISLFSGIQLAKSGYLNLSLLLPIVFVGTLLTDWFYFLAGRWRGRGCLDRFKSLQPKLARWEGRLERNSFWLLLLYRFIYGFRVVLPLIFGLSRVPVRRFALFSLVSTVLWISIYGTAAYFFTNLLADLWPGLAASLTPPAPGQTRL